MPTYAYFNVGGAILLVPTLPRGNAYRARPLNRSRDKTIKPNLSNLVALILLNGSLFSHDLAPWPILINHYKPKNLMKQELVEQ